MRLETNYVLSDDPVTQKAQLENYLRNISKDVNGKLTKWIPVIYGSTTAGTVTYYVQEGWYIRKGQVVDYWFQVYWKGWVDFAGHLYMGLPCKVWMSEENIWVGTCMVSDVVFDNAAHTYCTPIGLTNSYNCCFKSGTHNSTKAYVEAQNIIGGIQGHIRYLGQEGL